MRAFSILQKWSKMAKMTRDDLLTLKIALIEPPRKNEQNTLLVLLSSLFLAIKRISR